MDSNKELSTEWTGVTKFTIRRPRPMFGYTWILGRQVQVKKTTRPPHIMPEDWKLLGQPGRDREIAAWEKERP